MIKSNVFSGSTESRPTNSGRDSCWSGQRSAEPQTRSPSSSKSDREIFGELAADRGQPSLFAVLAEMLTHNVWSWIASPSVGAGILSKIRLDMQITYVPPEIVFRAPFSNSPLVDADPSLPDAPFPSIPLANHAVPSSIRDKAAKFSPASSC